MTTAREQAESQLLRDSCGGVALSCSGLRRRIYPGCSVMLFLNATNFTIGKRIQSAQPTAVGYYGRASAARDGALVYCAAHSDAYTPFRARRSSRVPVSTVLPPSITAILSSSLILHPRARSQNRASQLQAGTG